MRMKLLWLTLIGCSAMAACADNATEPPPFSPDLGIVTWDAPPSGFAGHAGLDPGSSWSEGSWGERPPLAVPDSAERGIPFSVTVTTALPSACWQAGENEVEIEEDRATITVYDHRSEAEVCAQVFTWATREIDLQFDESGEVTIRLVGRRIVGDDFEGGETLVVEQTVTIY